MADNDPRLKIRFIRVYLAETMQYAAEVVPFTDPQAGIRLTAAEARMLAERLLTAASELDAIDEAKSKES